VWSYFTQVPGKGILTHPRVINPVKFYPVTTEIKEKMKDREQWRLVVEEAKAHPGL
jgi:hypothetical protein